MRILQSTVFRALCAIVIGALLIKFPDGTVKGITIAIGVLFLLSGGISVATYFWSRRNVSEYKIYDADGQLVAGDQPPFPIVGIGSTLLGLILTVTPTSFVSALMYIIGIILVLGAVNQFMSLIGARRYGRVGLAYWVMPSLILLTGLYVMVKPMAPLEMAMLVLGWCTLLYGIAEVINALKLYHAKKEWQQQQPTQPQIDDTYTYEEIKDVKPTETPATRP